MCLSPLRKTDVWSFGVLRLRLSVWFSVASFSRGGAVLRCLQWVQSGVARVARRGGDVMSDEARDQSPLVRVSRVGKKVDGLTVLDGVCFELVPGEIVGLVGPNGAGKTTLLRVLSGLVQPTVGTATVVSSPLGSPAARRALSLMPEEPDCYPGLSVVEHIRLLDRLNGNPPSDHDIADMLSRYSLAAHRDSLPHELSQGMRQKLALILALRKGAEVFLLDEPFNGLDPVASRSLRQEIIRLAAQRKSVLISTHILRDLEYLADRVIFLHAGKVAKVVPLDTAFKEGTISLEDLYIDVVSGAGDAQT